MKSFWKRRSIIILAAAFLFCIPVAFVNYMVDPYWCFQHRVPIGQYQTSIDERQQKSNFLATRTPDIDTVIIGNSRVTYTDVLYIPGKTFNYASSSMKSVEFLPYLKFASSRSTLPVKTIILGLSFADTNKNSTIYYDMPEEYIKRALSPWFRNKSLLNLKLFYNSLKSIRKELKGDFHDAYTWEGGKVIPSWRMMLPVPEEIRKKGIESDLATYRERGYGKDFIYQDNRPAYEAIKEAFPDARILVFTTPVSEHLLGLLAEQGLFNHYARWIEDIVDSFGELWNFMYYNKITTDGLNYKDAHHYSPDVCHLIIGKIYETSPEDEYPDFGVKVAKDNLESHLEFLKGNILKGGDQSKSMGEAPASAPN